jgi:copper homeostasis protein CutC
MVSWSLSITDKSYVIRIPQSVAFRDSKAMVRPRAGDFFYSQEELDVMLEDIRLFKSIGIAGVVLGALNPDGTVDVPRTRMWVFEPAFIMICPYN